MKTDEIIERVLLQHAEMAFSLGVLACKNEIVSRMTNSVLPDGEVVSGINPQAIEEAVQAALKRWAEAELNENPSH